MSTVIRLDSTALAALIESDPDFKLELQRAVVAETVRKIFLKDFGQVIRETAPQLIADLVAAIKTDTGVRAEMEERLKATTQSIRSGTYGYSSQRELPKETKEAIANEVQDMIRAEVKEAGIAVVDLHNKLADRIVAELTERAENYIKRNVENEIVRRIQKGVQERITAMLAAAEGQG